MRTFSLFLRFLSIVWLFFCLFIFLQACSRVEQEPENYLVGVINPNKGTHVFNQSFIEGLASSGYVEGKNITYIQALNSEEMDKALEDMLDNDADLIFTATTPATKKAFAASQGKKIPIVFVLHDPVRAGVIENLTHPGKNITGIQIRGSVAKALEWLLTLAPNSRNIFVPVKFDTPAARQSLDDLRQAAGIKEIGLEVYELADPGDIAKAFAGIPRNIDAVFLLNSIMVSTHTDKIVAEAVKLGLPVGGGASTYHKGATITYGPEAPRVGRQASRLAHLILQGRKAEEIPAEVVEFLLGINMETARQAGITVPDEILAHADDIIPYKEKNSP